MKFLLLFSLLTLPYICCSAPITNSTGTVSLAWDASVGTNVIAGYNIYWGPSSLTYTSSISAGTNLTITITNLARGSAYYFAATAVDNNNYESDFSTEVSTTIPVPPPPPTTFRIVNVR